MARKRNKDQVTVNEVPLTLEQLVRKIVVRFELFKFSELPNPAKQVANILIGDGWLNLEDELLVTTKKYDDLGSKILEQEKDK